MPIRPARTIRHAALAAAFLFVFLAEAVAPSSTAQANHLSRGFRVTGVDIIDNATDAYHRGDLDRAISGYTRAINSRTLNRLNLAIAYFDRAVVFSDLGDHVQAIADYDQAIAGAPDEPLFYNNRGNSYHQLGQEEAAIQDYDEALQIDPRFAFVYYNRGTALVNLGAINEAVEDFNIALDVDPNLAVAYWGRGRVFRILGDFETALDDYEAAHQLDPGLDVALNRGFLFMFLGDFATAEAELGAECARGCDLYEALARYLALAHLTGNASGQLAFDTNGQDLSRWPGPMVEFFLGRLAEDALIRETFDDDPFTQRQQLTLATYMIGQLNLLEGDEDRAIAFFRATLEQDLPTWLQYTGAVEELRQLGVLR